MLGTTEREAAISPAGLLTVFSASDQRTDLVTIPPNTSEQDAASAMEQAARMPATGPGSS